MFRDHRTSAFSVGVLPNIWRCGAAAAPVVVGGQGGGMVQTRDEQNWEIPGVCWQLDSEALYFVLCKCDSTALTPIVPSLKNFLHKIHRASYMLPGTAFSHEEKCWLDSQFSLNLHIPMWPKANVSVRSCYMNRVQAEPRRASALRVPAATTSLFC